MVSVRFDGGAPSPLAEARTPPVPGEVACWRCLASNYSVLACFLLPLPAERGKTAWGGAVGVACGRCAVPRGRCGRAPGPMRRCKWTSIGVAAAGGGGRGGPLPPAPSPRSAGEGVHFTRTVGFRGCMCASPRRRTLGPLLPRIHPPGSPARTEGWLIARALAWCPRKAAWDLRRPERRPRQLWLTTYCRVTVQRWSPASVRT
jgi:hypothetical protein